jgi:hypothetical protein
MDSVVSLVDVADQRDDAYRAIGRYTVQFSMLVAAMREILSQRIVGSGSTEQTLLELAFGSLTAQQVADPFFAMCRQISRFDKHERAIEKCLREQVNTEIRERNVIAHGDWLIARWIHPDTQAPSPTLVRAKAANVKKPFDSRDLTVGQIDDICKRVEALGLIVWEFGTICTKQHAYDPRLGHPEQRAGSALHIVDKRVVFRPGTTTSFLATR